MIKHLKRGEYFGDLRQEVTAPAVHLSETWYPPGMRVPCHSHELPYFLLSVSGGFVETFTKKSYECKPMSVVFHPQGICHFGKISPEGCLSFNVQVRRSILERLHGYASQPETVADQSGGELSWLALRVFREYRQADDCSPLAIEGLVLEMLVAAARGSLPAEKRPPGWLDRVVELLHAEFQESLRVSDVASRIGVHPVHLSRVFRRFQGRSIADYVRQLRVRHACQLLSAAQPSLADVALDAGFADQSQFSRAFKQLTGVTPGRFRKTMTADGLYTQK